MFPTVGEFSKERWDTGVETEDFNLGEGVHGTRITVFTTQFREPSEI